MELLTALTLPGAVASGSREPSYTVRLLRASRSMKPPVAPVVEHELISMPPSRLTSMRAFYQRQHQVALNANRSSSAATASLPERAVRRRVTARRSPRAPRLAVSSVALAIGRPPVGLGLYLLCNFGQRHAAACVQLRAAAARATTRRPARPTVRRRIACSRLYDRPQSRYSEPGSTLDRAPAPSRTRNP